MLSMTWLIHGQAAESVWIVTMRCCCNDVVVTLTGWEVISSCSISSRKPVTLGTSSVSCSFSTSFCRPDTRHMVSMWSDSSWKTRRRLTPSMDTSPSLESLYATLIFEDRTWSTFTHTPFSACFRSIYSTNASTSSSGTGWSSLPSSAQSISSSGSFES